ncbi:MAG: glutamine synthetase family protein [Muribaculaceae bacterium]|nr:glutamine synthetase family protein [Muribaculaceae bacterium]
MNKHIDLSKNAVVAYLKKAPSTFTRADIIDYIVNNDIKMVNFKYPAADGRLKTLNFNINDRAYLETILTLGERVDGSSLFPYIGAGNSDLYVIPRYRTAFLDPFASEPTLTMLCSFFDKDGTPLASAPEQLLDKACRALTETTGLTFHAMGELEYYVIGEDPATFPAGDQRGYHESGPFAKFNDFRTRCMKVIAQCGGQIKYGHSEVGNFTLDGKIYEQNEIEFLPVDARDAADQLLIAKWCIRKLAFEEGLDVTFAPKIIVGKAGSGLHVHMRLMNADGSSAMLAPDGTLSTNARRAIAGLMDLAPAITAFGNTNPTSYFRLVPHQEAPTNVCWGDRNRSVLVRVPLGWTAGVNMCETVNGPQPDTCADVDARQKQTFEIRSADCSADIYQLMAALAVAVRHGFEMPDALDVAQRHYVDIDIHKAENQERQAQLPTLPTNCAESASCLESRKDVFEAMNVFPADMLSAIIANLRRFDSDESAQAIANPDKMAELVKRYFYCG